MQDHVQALNINLLGIRLQENVYPSPCALLLYSCAPEKLTDLPPVQRDYIAVPHNGYPPFPLQQSYHSGVSCAISPESVVDYVVNERTTAPSLDITRFERFGSHLYI